MGKQKNYYLWLVHRGRPGAKGQVFKEVVHGKMPRRSHDT